MSAITSDPIRVVVAGVGAITAQGMGADALWEGVKAGRVAIRPVQRLPMDGYRTQIGGEVQQEFLPEHDYRRPEEFRELVIDFALKAAEEAVAAAGDGVKQIPPERWGLVIGTCNTGMLSGERWYSDQISGQPVDPELVVLVPPQALAEAVAGAFEVKGPVLSIDTACAASANAIGLAAELVRTGQADAVLTGGSDALSTVLFAGFNALQSLSPEPAAPYSRDRQGLSLGEGSGMLVLVREDLAREIGLPMLAEVLAYGLSADGYHPTAPHPEGKGASRAMHAALRAAGVSPDEVRYVNSHGTGTPKNDPAETKATKLGLGEAAQHVLVSSTKSMIGHLLGAAGAAEAIVTIRALQEQVAPPTANYREPDPECDLDYVPNAARPLAMDVAMSNNFAFGGANASLILARPGTRTMPLPHPDLDRVVVTGLGVLSTAGAGVDQLWDAFVTERECTRIENGARVGRVEVDPSPFLSPRERRRMDRLGIFSVIASRLALQDAGLELTDDNRNRIGTLLGTGIGPMESMEEFTRPVVQEGPAAANPAVFPNTVYNAATGQVAMQVGALGPTSTITAGHAAGASAICYGYDLTSRDQADAMICLAVDTLTDTVIRGYQGLGMLAGETRSADGRGIALAEAGIAIVVERLSAARSRGARIYGELSGYAIASDGLGLGQYDREGKGLERAMRQALERTGIGPNEVTAIWSGLMGHQPADDAESAAIERVFGDSARVVAPKRQFGEPMGAGGALSTALALQGWEHRPPGVVLVNSSSMGGTHFSLVLVPYREHEGNGRG